jgi:hypothetical protein
MIKWEGHVAQMREKRNAYRSLVGNPEEKRPIGRPRLKGIFMKHDESGVNWIHLAQHREEGGIL